MNTYPTQPLYSVLCGLHVLYILYFLARGQTLYSVLADNFSLTKIITFCPYHLAKNTNAPKAVLSREKVITQTEKAQFELNISQTAFIFSAGVPGHKPPSAAPTI